MDQATAKNIILFHAAHITEHPTREANCGLLLAVRGHGAILESDLLEVIAAVRILKHELVRDMQTLTAYYDLTYYMGVLGEAEWIKPAQKEQLRYWRDSLGWPLSCLLNDVVLGKENLELAFEGFDNEDWREYERRLEREKEQLVSS